MAATQRLEAWGQQGSGQGGPLRGIADKQGLGGAGSSCWRASREGACFPSLLLVPRSGHCGGRWGQGPGSVGSGARAQDTRLLEEAERHAGCASPRALHSADRCQLLGEPRSGLPCHPARQTTPREEPSTPRLLLTPQQQGQSGHTPRGRVPTPTQPPWVSVGPGNYVSNAGRYPHTPGQDWHRPNTSHHCLRGPPGPSNSSLYLHLHKGL